MTSDPTPRQQPSGSQPPTTAPTTDEMSGTDLPLPRWGSSGITVDHIEALLDAARGGSARTSVARHLAHCGVRMATRRASRTGLSARTVVDGATRDRGVPRRAKRARRRSSAHVVPFATTRTSPRCVRPERGGLRKTQHVVHDAPPDSPSTMRHGNGIDAEPNPPASDLANTSERSSPHERAAPINAVHHALSQ